jgi:hypothetical protein
MVAKQEKIDYAPSFLDGKLANGIKRANYFIF